PLVLKPGSPPADSPWGELSAGEGRNMSRKERLVAALLLAIAVAGGALIPRLLASAPNSLGIALGPGPSRSVVQAPAIPRTRHRRRVRPSRTRRDSAAPGEGDAARAREDAAGAGEDSAGAGEGCVGTCRSPGAPRCARIRAWQRVSASSAPPRGPSRSPCGTA